GAVVRKCIGSRCGIETRRVARKGIKANGCIAATPCGTHERVGADSRFFGPQVIGEEPIGSHCRIGAAAGILLEGGEAYSSIALTSFVTKERLGAVRRIL